SVDGSALAKQKLVAFCLSSHEARSPNRRELRGYDTRSSVGQYVQRNWHTSRCNSSSLPVDATVSERGASTPQAKSSRSVIPVSTIVTFHDSRGGRRIASASFTTR